MRTFKNTGLAAAIVAGLGAIGMPGGAAVHISRRDREAIPYITGDNTRANKGWTPKRRPGRAAAAQKRTSIKARNVRRHKLAMKRRGGK